MKTLRTVAALLAAAFCLSAVPAGAQGQKLLHEEKSLYRNIRVLEEGGQRCLMFRARRLVGYQSCIEPANPDKLVLEYSRMMLAGLYMNAAPPKRVMIIGLGGGVLPRTLQGLLPNARIDVVELDPGVDKVARGWFGFKPGPNMRVVISDGRVFVKRRPKNQAPYDLVLLDAFNEDYIPEHMLTRGFLEEVKATMAPNGVIAANTFSGTELYDHESTTYKAVFGQFYTMPRANRIILARLGGLPSMAEVRAAAATWDDAFRKRGVAQTEIVPMITTRVDWDEKARILTDQYSPSNLLNSRKRG
jgi:spermidine synthase